MLNWLKEKSVAFYLRAISVVFAIPSLLYLFNAFGTLSETPSEYTPAAILLIIGIVAEIVAMVVDKHSFSAYIALVGTVFLSFAFALFLAGSCLSVIDFIYNIIMWGDAKQFPAIVAFGVCLFLSCGTNIVADWI